jgi:adenine C2-methylase RlmN of 23S rRNA A2503 and tRNA A37
MSKKCFFDSSPVELVKLLTENGYELYRLQQIYHHIIDNDRKDFNCAQLPKQLRLILNSKYNFSTSISEIQKQWTRQGYKET